MSTTSESYRQDWKYIGHSGKFSFPLCSRHTKINKNLYFFLTKETFLMPGWPYFVHCTKCHTIKIHLTKQVVLTDIRGSTLIGFFSIPLKLYFVFYFSRTIVFHPEGNALFSGSHDMLKIHQWEPGPRVCDAVSMGWGKIRDMAVSASQLVRCNSNFQK